MDALRGVAALGVVFYHAYEGNHLSGLLAALPAWVAHVLKHGALGVPVFFVLSGFVISHSVARSRVTPSFIGRFMLRRSIRLDPPYWFAIALAIGFAVLSARVVPGKEQPAYAAGQIMAHLLYLQEVLSYPAINPVFWTLCQEVQFYFVYVLLLGLARNDPLLPLQGPRTALLLGLAALLSLLWPLGLVTTEPWRGSFLPLWHNFLLGAGAYWAWRHAEVVPFYLAYGALLLFAGMSHSDNFTTASVLTSLLLWTAAASGRIVSACSWRWLQVLGAISYSLYLTHNPITGAAFRAGYTLTGRSPILEAFWWFVVTGACLAFAWCVWWLIERPSIGLAGRIPLASPPAEDLRSPAAGGPERDGLRAAKARAAVRDP